jgi:hypothetical protein
MAIGCLVGAIWQHGTRSALHLTLFMGGLLGTIGGLIAGVFLGWEVGGDREGTLGACLGTTVGGILGIVAGGWVGRKRAKSARLVTIPLLGLVGALGGLFAGANYLGDRLAPVLGGDGVLVGGFLGLVVGVLAGVILGRLLGGSAGK